MTKPPDDENDRDYIGRMIDELGSDIESEPKDCQG